MERKKVGIISGKGGVGKTSLVASLASLSMNDPDLNAAVIDCDVDAPNLALILPTKDNNEIYHQDTYTTLKASFLNDKCISCKKCIEDHYCEFNALSWDEAERIPILDYLACEGCGACKVLCSEHAFEIKPVKSGEIISYESKSGLPLIFGKTRLGSTSSGKLVSECKEYAQTSDSFSKSNLILIDGPPGIGCPVIATISGLDYIITITEPTPSGLHDLIRAIEVIEQFNLPFGIVINKYDIESDFRMKFENYISETRYHVLGKIPFDIAIPEAMSFAKPVVEHAPKSQASISIGKIFIKLKSLLWIT